MQVLALAATMAVLATVLLSLLVAVVPLQLCVLVPLALVYLMPEQALLQLQAFGVQHFQLQFVYAPKPDRASNVDRANPRAERDHLYEQLHFGLAKVVPLRRRYRHHRPEFLDF